MSVAVFTIIAGILSCCFLVGAITTKIRRVRFMGLLGATVWFLVFVTNIFF